MSRIFESLVVCIVLCVTSWCTYERPHSLIRCGDPLQQPIACFLLGEGLANEEGLARPCACTSSESVHVCGKVWLMRTAWPDLAHVPYFLVMRHWLRGAWRTSMRAVLWLLHERSLKGSWTPRAFPAPGSMTGVPRIVARHAHARGNPALTRVFLVFRPPTL